MISGWVVLLVLLVVAVATVLVALAGGWRPGRGVKRNTEQVHVEVRDRLMLPVHDWWTVRRAVRKGRQAPQPLRPAAYELADELVRFQDQSSWPPPRRVLVILLVGLYLAFFAAWVLVDGLRWAAVLRPVPTVALAAALLAGDARGRARIRRAREVNA